jgi:hypothetical protein
VRHEREKPVQRGYEEARNPEAQGDGDPGPDQIRERASLQGHAGRAHSGQGGATTTERSHAGEPESGHTGDDRQHVPGDRDSVQPT